MTLESSWTSRTLNASLGSQRRRGSTVQRGWDEQKFTVAVAENFCVAGVLRSLGLATAGNSYEVVREECKRLDLDTSHWRGRGYRVREKQKLSELLVVDSKATNATLKRWMTREGVLASTCAVCGQEPVWQGQPLTLRLDHINGDRTDARRENLRLLCPNCDSQTDTYCGRNVKRSRDRRGDTRAVRLCPCGKAIGPRSLQCLTCKNRQQPTKIDWPPLEVMLTRLQNTPVTTLAQELGVSGNAVTKHLRHQGAKKGSSGWVLE